MKLFEYPEHLRPFAFHGMDLTYREGHSQAIADCFMCGKEAKFHISIETGQWDCKVCGEKGNVFSFLRKLWEHSSDCQDDKVALTKLRATRTLLSTDTLVSWGVRRSCLTNEWIIPGWPITKQSIGQLYRWVKDREKGKHLLLATPGIGHHIFGLNLFNEKAKTVYVCEGPWDGMALWEVLSRCSKMEDGSLKEVTSKKMSLLSDASVISVPGCNAFNELWGEILENRDVVFLYDNDHVIDQTKQGDPPALAGLKKAVRTLTSSEFKAASIKYLNWGKEHGVYYDPKLASGFDVRDALSGESIKDRINALQSTILQRIDPIPDDWKGEAKKTLACSDWKTLVNEWKKALRWTDGLDNALAVMLASIASTETPGDQLWVKIIGPPSCGKSTLCEAVSTCEKYVMQKSVIRGFHSGFKLDKEGKEDLSLLAKLRNKTLVTKDGDTLMKSPNAPQILSEARDIYDKTTSAHYRNNLSREYKNICMTWILCGTSSLRSLDQSELGERFLDCVVVHEMDMSLEKQIQRRVINRQIFNMISEEKKAEDEEDGKILRARRLTGGYVEYLRKNILKKLREIKTDSIEEKYIEMCENLALFVAHIRSRPSLKQQEEVERELSLRLCSQLTKLMLCLVVVTGKKTVDDEVMRRVTKVALDTARGRTFNIVKRIYKQGDTGIDHITLSKLTNESRDKELALLRFLKKINVVRVIGHKKNSHLAIWSLTPQMKRLFTAICGEMDIEDNHYRLF